MAGFDAVVIGAGVIGVTVAYQLRRAGLSVALLERHQGPAHETSSANGGLITPSMSDPWASPGLPLQIARWIGREDAPFLVRLRALPALTRWGYDFIGNCTEERWRSNAARILALARYSQQCFAELMARELLDCDLCRLGTLRLFRDAVSMEKAGKTAALMCELGVDCRQLDARQCLEVEPALRNVPAAFHGGLHYPQDQSADCSMFTQKLAEVCVRMGAEACYSTTALAVEPISGPRRHRVRTNAAPVLADNVVFATAVLPKRLASRATRWRLPIYPVKGYSITLSSDDMSTAPRVPIVDDASKIGLNRLGERLRLVGTAEFCGYDRNVTSSRIGALFRNAEALVPDLRNYRIEGRWAGLRPMTPDGVPYIGQLRQPGIFVSVGHGHLGWTNACGAAVVLRDLMCGATPAVDASQYAPC